MQEGSHMAVLIGIIALAAVIITGKITYQDMF